MTPQQDAVNQIVQAYLKTHMTERQFEDMVIKIINDAETRGAQNSTGGFGYDRGFSDGYDACFQQMGDGNP